MIEDALLPVLWWPSYGWTYSVRECHLIRASLIPSMQDSGLPPRELTTWRRGTWVKG